MIEILEGFPEGVVADLAKGQVTKGDYDEVLTPAIEAVYPERAGKVSLGATCDGPLPRLRDRFPWDEATFADASGSDGRAPKAERQPTRTTGALAGYATRDFRLLKSLKIATVAPTPLAIWRVR